MCTLSESAHTALLAPVHDVEVPPALANLLETQRRLSLAPSKTNNLRSRKERIG